MKSNKGKSEFKRPSWDEYFLSIAEDVSTRATCMRRRVGAILVKDKRILTTGYNGAPRGMKHCSDIGCIREEMKVPSGERHELCRGLHAEMNALIQAAAHGISVEGAVLYCTNLPCVLCSKMLINAGVKKIVIRERYPDELSDAMLREAKVEIKIKKKSE